MWNCYPSHYKIQTASKEHIVNFPLNYNKKSNGKVCFNLFRREYSGPPLDWSDRPDWKLPFHFEKPLISRFSSVDFQLYRGLRKVRVIQLSVGPVWSENIVLTFSRRTGSKTIQFKRPGTIRNLQITVSFRKLLLGSFVYLSRKNFLSGREN